MLHYALSPYRKFGQSLDKVWKASKIAKEGKGISSFGVSSEYPLEQSCLYILPSNILSSVLEVWSLIHLLHDLDSSVNSQFLQK